MSFDPKHSADRRATARTYSPAALHTQQSLLATLADLDCAYDIDLETVETSGVPESIKREVIRTLKQRHQERRAPYVRKLEALQTQGHMV
jgi:hypothetical protein